MHSKANGLRFGSCHASQKKPISHQIRKRADMRQCCITASATTVDEARKTANVGSFITIYITTPRDIIRLRRSTCMRHGG
jgi:hypothetical protein